MSGLEGVGPALLYLFVLIPIWIMLSLCAVAALVCLIVKRRDYATARAKFYRLLALPSVWLLGSTAFAGWYFFLSPASKPPSFYHSLSGPLSLTDPKMKPFRAMYAAPAAQYGFVPLPKAGQATIRRDTDPDDAVQGYDTELEITGAPGIPAGFPWVAYFKQVNGQYVWTGEQENFDGPHTWKDGGGGVHKESIMISYQQKTEGMDFDISYFGSDPRLQPDGKGLTPKDIRPILKEWRVVK